MANIDDEQFAMQDYRSAAKANHARKDQFDSACGSAENKSTRFMPTRKTSKPRRLITDDQGPNFHYSSI